MNTKGWVRIVEAFIAVLIITGGILVILSRESKTDNNSSEKIYEKQRNILDVVIKNDSLRDKIIIGENQEVNNAISLMVSNNWNFTTNICDVNEICNTNTPNDRDVYVSEIVVSSNLTQYSPKKLRFFVWIGRRTNPAPPIIPPQSIMSLTDPSNVWVNGGEIPGDYRSGAANQRHPDLKITNIPNNAKSLLLIFEKQDGSEVYWFVWDIPRADEIIINENWPQSGEGVEGRNTLNGGIGYKGPPQNPPGGNAFTCILTVYALDIDIPIGLNQNTASKTDALNKMNDNGDHIIQSAVYTGTISP